MSHFAELDENNTVLRVVVGDNNKTNEGLDWIVENLGGRWVQTSYNRTFRKHFAAPGFTYSEELDAFIPPQPFPSWTLNTEACVWVAPVPYPVNEEGLEYVWNESQQNWILIEE